jgi:hypothetical protein
MHWVGYPIRLNLLEYLIKPMMFTCSHYNMSGYKMFMNIGVKGSDAKKVY